MLFFNNKGGVGKTTVVVNLADALAIERNARVLIVDLDSQANATFAAGVVKSLDDTRDELRNCNVSNLLLGGRGGFAFFLQESFQSNSVRGVRKNTSYSFSNSVDIIPSHIQLTTLEDNLAESYSRGGLSNVLRKKLAEISNKYEYVLIDTLPSLNVYAKIALFTADYLIIPCDLSIFAETGLKNVKEFVDRINDDKRKYNFPPLVVLGILPTKIPPIYNYVNHSLPKIKERITRRYGLPILKTIIYQRPDLNKCTAHYRGYPQFPEPKSIFAYNRDPMNSPKWRGK